MERTINKKGRASNMDKKMVTRKEFETLLKELDIWDVTKNGYGYILLSICNDLFEDAKMFKEARCPLSYEKTMEQHDEVRDFLKSRGYFQNL